MWAVASGRGVLVGLGPPCFFLNFGHLAQVALESQPKRRALSNVQARMLRLTADRRGGEKEPEGERGRL